MSKINKFSPVIILWLFTVEAIAQDELVPTYPSIPPSYEVLRPSTLVSKSRVNFPSYLIRNTNGYKVTSPEGNTFVVDSIVQPKCVFYATYVATNDDGFLGVSSAAPVVSNVYIGELNFDKCQ